MKQYLELLETIKEKGCYKPAARENMPGTQSRFGHQFRHDLSEGFPLLTTKKMKFNNIVVELLWFLRGDTNIKYLVDNGCNIWNEDAYNYYCKKHKQILSIEPINSQFHLLCKKPISYEEFVQYIKDHSRGELKTFEQYFDDYSYGDCGYQYGRVWRKWQGELDEIKISSNGDSFTSERAYKQVDQIKNLINTLRKSPESRRHIVTAWDPAHDQELALTWCHALFQFNCRPIVDSIYFEGDGITYGEKGQYYMWTKHPKQHGHYWEFVNVTKEEFENAPKYLLDCQLYQRSADSVLGVPYNLASYSLLTHILAKMCNMIPGEFIHTFGDVHIYDNHKEAVETQLKRTPTQLPILNISSELDINLQNTYSNIDILLETLQPEWFTVENYNPLGFIKAELSTGLVK